MIEHHIDLLETIASRMTVMNFGHKIAEGEPALVREDDEVVRCYLGSGHRRAPDGAKAPLPREAVR